MTRRGFECFKMPASGSRINSDYLRGFNDNPGPKIAPHRAVAKLLGYDLTLGKLDLLLYDYMVTLGF